MPARTHAIDQAQPAWPTLVGIQVVVLAALVGLGWRTMPAEIGPPPPVEQRLQSLDVPAAMLAVERALDQNRNPRALTTSDERYLSSFLALCASSARLEVLAVRVFEGSLDDGLQTVDAIVALRGDIYDLPVFVDAVHLQRALVRLEEITVQAWPGGAAELQVRLRFHRPPAVESDWIGERLSTAAPGCDRAVPVLEKAVELAGWRGFSARAPALADRAGTIRRQAASDLPAHLVSLRRTGGRLTWAPDGEIRIRRN